MGVIKMISVAKRTSSKTSGPNLTARVPDHVVRAFSAVCDDMGVTKTSGLVGLLRWYCQLPRSARQLILGMHDDDEMAEIAHQRLVDSLRGKNRPDIADLSDSEPLPYPSKEN